MILNVRTLQEYCGEVFMLKPSTATQCGGCIPGAVHLEHTLMLNNERTYKSAPELYTLYNNQKITADKHVFPYSAIGGRAYTWFVLMYLLDYPHVRSFIE